MTEENIDAAKNRGHELLARTDAALAHGRISEAQWYQQVDAAITPAYIGADGPRAQSGHSGNEEHWTQARSIVAEAFDQGGTFLDVGCANGYLMESAQRWALAAGRVIVPHGLDISPELIHLARERLPQWADRIWLGNVIDWEPPSRFDFVRTGLEHVPSHRSADLIEWLLDAYVAQNGRLIIGTYNEQPDAVLTHRSLRQEVESLGFAVAGVAERDHWNDPRIRYKIMWLERQV